jgi:AMMECR1 domain-containing protein
MPGGIYIKLARSAAEHYIQSGELLPVPTYLTPELQWPAACYVSLLENPGKFVRARYGQPFARQPSLAQEIIWNTVQAISTSSSRLIRRIDLAYLAYAVAVVGPLERITDPSHLQPASYGLYLRSDRDKTAVILPRRAGIETGEDQIATAMREAGVDSHQESVNLYRFAVTFYE